jgi:cytochrome P450
MTRFGPVHRSMWEPDPMNEPTSDLDPADWDPRDPAFRADPLPWYRALRQKAPVFGHAEIGIVLSRYEDIDRVLRDRCFGVATPSPWREAFAAEAPPSMQLLSESSLLFIDPPRHTRVRGLVAQAFTPRRIEALRPRIEAMIDGILDDLDHRLTFDVLEEIAWPIPIMGVTDLLDVPATDQELLHRWTHAITAVDELPLEFDLLPAAGEAADEFLAYAGVRPPDRRRHPGDDLISGLIAAQEVDGEVLHRDELLSMIVLILLAGHDTTASLISTALWLLLSHPDQADEVRNDPRVVPGAIEEVLRYLGPLQVASGGGRWPAEPVTIKHTVIEPGTPVRLLLGSANRDPAQYDDPDRFDIHREAIHHLAFGRGLHVCLGSALGRLEAQVVVPAVLRRFPDLRLVDDQPTWRPSFVVRQLATLAVDTGRS